MQVPFLHFGGNWVVFLSLLALYHRSRGLLAVPSAAVLGGGLGGLPWVQDLVGVFRVGGDSVFVSLLSWYIAYIHCRQLNPPPASLSIHRDFLPSCVAIRLASSRPHALLSLSLPRRNRQGPHVGLFRKKNFFFLIAARDVDEGGRWAGQDKCYYVYNYFVNARASPSLAPEYLHVQTSRKKRERREKKEGKRKGQSRQRGLCEKY
ncbi:hypothetical protein GGS23DRAFT_359393 [Durotheca rogersii]|uniref:uncharacterized protein n=1 Tax=Durotheca rogersii TaxID=419775 RepID=UPI0022206D2C|nr:uncharacterized protein GGS23DRAFT_359393 [Durotheca rogersii]KAI5865902.1 hypothetical protein GGS23DRAFT_359393 [Durotheca rogersii]